MIPLEGDYGLWATLLSGFVLGYGILEGIIGALIAAGAAAGIGKSVHKAVKEGVFPWDDPLGFMKDTYADAIPVAGPLIETATEGGDWGNAGMQSGIQLATLAAGALGGAAAPAGEIGAEAASTIGEQAAKHAALGMPVAEDLAAVGSQAAKAGAAAGPATIAEGGGAISRAADAFSNIQTPADIGPAIQELGAGAREAVQAPFKALGRATHPAVGNVAYRAAVGAGRGAATNPRNPLRGAVSGVAGSLGTIAAGEGATYLTRSGLPDLASPKFLSAHSADRGLDSYLSPGRGPAVQGNINLLNRPQVANPDGSMSSVRSMSFNQDGQEVLVPTVSEDGRIMSDTEAMSQYDTTGRHLGKFPNVEQANNYGDLLHRQQESFYGSPGRDRLSGLATSLPAQAGGQLASGMAFRAMTPEPPKPRMYQSPYPWQRYYGRSYT